MATILTGFEVRQGTFQGNDGKPVYYSNRILKLMTDDGADNLSFFGFSGYEEKLNSLNLCRWLHLRDDDEWRSLDNWLKNHLNKPVEFLRAPVNGQFTITGIKAVEKS